MHVCVVSASLSLVSPLSRSACNAGGFSSSSSNGACRQLPCTPPSLLRNPLGLSVRKKSCLAVDVLCSAKERAPPAVFAKHPHCNLNPLGGLGLRGGGIIMCAAAHACAAGRVCAAAHADCRRSKEPTASATRAAHCTQRMQAQQQRSGHRRHDRRVRPAPH